MCATFTQSLLGVNTPKRKFAQNHEVCMLCAIMSTTRQTAHKPSKAIRINISMSAVLRDAAEKIIRERGYSGLSDYIHACIRRESGMLN
jgi:hypothetical protein